ncbi:TetR/AcrR family transcriptional regulator [Kushneria marisflavi]|uniref:TetR family transcriptional regulator n=1 Tax=Kushneria marisflavi TaxID=157779 RepID=A0A240UNU9_9GAMM|nr:TetR/AcrR family transcriptional regulator [Kushneria marisflavi]ART63187.1 TetR family transcriptional regulator [Kushneria marisflavi]RKD84210.1 TetR family transcriptional regulator [Kushneria marisflavi]
MQTPTPSGKRRGRPPKVPRHHPDTREALIHCGVEVLTEQGFVSTGIDGVLKRVGVPKGSFYHYFDSKEAFGHAVLACYADYFARRLDRCLLDAGLSPLERLRHFTQNAQEGMARHDYRRGCLVGNLGQEVTLLPAGFDERLEAILQDWQRRVADCLRLAQTQGELAGDADCDALAAFFWIGWEGAVQRARLVRGPAPLVLFRQEFFARLPR